MQPSRVKKILREGGLALGTYTGGIADPQIVEIIGHAGYDAAFIDMEHTSFDLRDIQLMVMAAERAGITPIVRTPGFDPAFFSSCSTWACKSQVRRWSAPYEDVRLKPR
jgi:4-hydroxy-2-oxoheptanedioate aldolase